MLLTVVPEALHDEMGIGDWSWVDELYAQDGVMAKVIAELEHDLEGLNRPSSRQLTMKNIAGLLNSSG